MGSFGRQVWLGVYTGDTLSSLHEVGSGPDSVAVGVVMGTTYRIAVDGAAGTGASAMGSFGVRVSMKLVSGPRRFQEGLPAESPAPGPDKTAPQTTISRKALKRKPPIFVFGFSSSEPGSSFRCSLDGAPFKRCGKSRTFSKPGPKRHTLRVYAVDAAGNADPSPAIARFKIAPLRRHKAN